MTAITTLRSNRHAFSTKQTKLLLKLIETYGDNSVVTRSMILEVIEKNPKEYGTWQFIKRSSAFKMSRNKYYISTDILKAEDKKAYKPKPILSEDVTCSPIALFKLLSEKEIDKQDDARDDATFNPVAKVKKTNKAKVIKVSKTPNNPIYEDDDYNYSTKNEYYYDESDMSDGLFGSDSIDDILKYA